MAVPAYASELLHGPLTAAWPISLRAVMCDLRPRFIRKCQVGRGYRAVARNGRVLLASKWDLPELAGREVQVRVQAWHKMILPGEPAEEWGVVVWIGAARVSDVERPFAARLVKVGRGHSVLGLEVGGGMSLNFD
jgi:hypothetical protein